MKFEKEIAKAFSDLGFVPINGQDLAINEILEAFLEEGKQTVILSAPTGIGKSIIGAVVAKVFYNKYRDQMNSAILMQTNSLVEQYSNTFSKMPDSEFFQIKGASNYECEAVRKLKNEQFANGEDCIKNKLSNEQRENFCSNCEFAYAKKMINTTENLITNYSYFFISKLWSNHLRERTLTIFDEAHTLNDVFVDHCSVHITSERLEKYIEECKSLIPSEMTVINRLIKLKQSLDNDAVGPNNYISFVESVGECYSFISKSLMNKSSMMDMFDQSKYDKATKKFFNLKCKISDFAKYKFEHALHQDFEKKEVTIKPIFIGRMSNLILGDHNLFMSATLPEELMTMTMDLQPGSFKTIYLDPVFSPENKKVVLSKAKHSLNYSAMKSPLVVNDLKTACQEIAQSHSKDKGLILVPSFVQAKMIGESIKVPGMKVFIHQSGTKIDHLVKQFKSHRGAAVLISPSIYEGLDFKGEDSRWQIITKAPYASLADERIKYICNEYPNWYRLMALMKIIQGIGRSIRAQDDYAITYILDVNAVKLFNSSQNVWQKEFTVL